MKKSAELRTEMGGGHILHDLSDRIRYSGGAKQKFLLLGTFFSIDVIPIGCREKRNQRQGTPGWNSHHLGSR